MTWLLRLLRLSRTARREPLNRRRIAILALSAAIPLLLSVYAVAFVVSMPAAPGRELRYNDLLSALRNGDIDNVTILTVDRRITGTDHGQPFWFPYGTDNSPIITNLVVAFQGSSVDVAVDDQFLKGLFRSSAVAYVLPALLITDVMGVGYLLVQGGMGGFRRASRRRLVEGESKVTFKDVAGVDDAIVELGEIRGFLSDPDRYRALGARVPRGILLAGPPGCGKTLLARAVAGEADAVFFSVSGSSFVEMFVGVGASRIRELFAAAQREAPSIVFIDEVDAVGRGRLPNTGGDQAERESTLNQLLVALDGFDGESGVVVIAATNRPDILDPALLRPGRIDRHVTIGLPDVAGRRDILAVHVRGKPVADDVDLGSLARRTAGFSGADLASVVNEAALLCARERGDTISMTHFSEGLERVLVGPERRSSHLLSPREKELAAYHEAGHAIVSAALFPEERVGKISVVARGIGGGMTYYVEEDRLVDTRDRMMSRLARMMGGRAAEQVIAGDATTAEDDLHRATLLARRMVGELGMGEQLGPVSLKVTGAMLATGLAAQPSPEMMALADAEVRAILKEALETAHRVLAEKRGLLEGVARRLIEAESLEGAELDEMLYAGGPAVRALGT